MDFHLFLSLCQSSNLIGSFSIIFSLFYILISLHHSVVVIQINEKIERKWAGREQHLVQLPARYLVTSRWDLGGQNVIKVRSAVRIMKEYACARARALPGTLSGFFPFRDHPHDPRNGIRCF